MLETNLKTEMENLQFESFEALIGENFQRNVFEMRDSLHLKDIYLILFK